MEDEQRRDIDERRIEHERGQIRAYLSQFPRGTPVAVETIGNWYWIVDEIEEAGMVPRLVHARKAKMMMGMINKTDKLDVKGLNQLQRNDTLPTAWIPPGEIRDERDLARTWMVFAVHRTRLKNRIQSVLAEYGLQRVEEVSDIFGKKGRTLLEGSLMVGFRKISSSKRAKIGDRNRPTFAGRSRNTRAPTALIWTRASEFSNSLKRP